MVMMVIVMVVMVMAMEMRVDQCACITAGMYGIVAAGAVATDAVAGGAVAARAHEPDINCIHKLLSKIRILNFISMLFPIYDNMRTLYFTIVNYKPSCYGFILSYRI